LPFTEKLGFFHSFGHP
jgi:predicted AAA+ superfamily ATPase